MKTVKIITFCISLISLYSFSGNRNAPASLIGKTVNPFTLRNIDNKNVSLNDFKNARGFIIVFTCNHCPFAKLYSERFSALNLKYKSLDVPLIAINSMDTAIYDDESFELMKQKASSSKFNFPYLHDVLQTVGKNFNAEHTPHAFVIWKEKNNWVIKYSGAIDDNGEHPESSTPYIANAAEELLHNKPVSKPETQSFGCKIFYRK